MRRVRFALGAGALLAAGALAFALVGRSPAPRGDASETASSRRAPAPAGIEPALPPEGAPTIRADSGVTRGSVAPHRPDESASRPEIDVLALEDQALRRIDVIPLLKAAGIDVRALRARPDADDILRHVAGDELLTRGFMRDLFAATIYPSGYSRDDALRSARVAAETMVGALPPEARAESLASELEAGTGDLPEPVFHPAESGRIYDARAGGDAN